MTRPVYPLYNTGTPTTVTATASSAAALAANKSRRYAFITNTGTNPVSLAMNTAAVIGEGITLPAGATYEMRGDNLCQSAVNCISNDGTTLSILEGT